MKTTLSLIGIAFMFISIAILVAMETGFIEKAKMVFGTNGNSATVFPIVILFLGVAVLIKGVSPSKNPGTN